LLAAESAAVENPEELVNWFPAERATEMAVPVLLPTAARDAAYAGVTYHIQGELVPALHLELNEMPVYFEHHILLWKDPAVEVGIKTLQGAFKRMISGMPIFMTEARGPGRIAFSRDGAGHVFALHLATGSAVDVREHQFLAATDSVDYSYSRVQGVTNLLFGGTGFFVDTFHCSRGEGVLWLHGYGNVFEVTLGPGEQIDLDPGAWIFKERSVQMETITQRIKTSFFASGSLFWNRFTGPGRLGLQSMSVHLPTAE
jgi:uncharacterized protein (AIM24 family)